MTMRPDDATEQFPRTTPGRITNVPSPSHRQPRRWPGVLGMIVLLLVALSACGACGAAFMAAGPSTTYPAPEPVTTLSGGATVAPATGPTPTPPVTTVEVQEWGQGTWIVGDDIQPGKYKTEGADGALFAFCMATRESDSGSMIDVESTNEGPAYITVKASDGQLSLSGPCTWRKVN